MSDDAVVTLLRQSGFSFVGTVERTGATTMSDVPANQNTSVVQVERILDAPSSLANLAGQEITVQLAAGAAGVVAGQRLALFTNIAVLGKSAAVTEVGRLPASDVEPHVVQAMTANRELPFARLRRQIASDDLRAHAGDAEVVVVGRIIRLEQATEERYAEHDPHYWRATLRVHHVEKGNIQGQEVTFVYPASQDVRWIGTPKPEPRQVGMWMLHATSGAASSLAPFELIDADDYHPVQHLEPLRRPAPGG